MGLYSKSIMSIGKRLRKNHFSMSFRKIYYSARQLKESIFASKRSRITAGLIFIVLVIVMFYIVKNKVKDIINGQNAKKYAQEVAKIDNFEECIKFRDSFAIEGRAGFMPHACNIDGMEYLRWNIDPDTSNWKIIKGNNFEFKYPEYYSLVLGKQEEKSIVNFFGLNEDADKFAKNQCNEHTDSKSINCPKPIVILEVKGGYDPADNEKLFNLLKSSNYKVVETLNHDIQLTQMTDWWTSWFNPSYIRADYLNPQQLFKIESFNIMKEGRFATGVIDIPEYINTYTIGQVDGKIFQLSFESPAVNYFKFRKNIIKDSDLPNNFKLYSYLEYDFNDLVRGVLSTIKSTSTSNDQFPYKNNQIPRKDVLYLGTLICDNRPVIFFSNYYFTEKNNAKKIDPFIGVVMYADDEPVGYCKEELNYSDIQNPEPLLLFDKNNLASVETAKFDKDTKALFITYKGTLYGLDTTTYKYKSILNVSTLNKELKTNLKSIYLESTHRNPNSQELYLTLNAYEIEERCCEGPFINYTLVFNTKTNKYTPLGFVGDINYDFTNNQLNSRKMVKELDKNYEYHDYFDYVPKGDLVIKNLP